MAETRAATIGRDGNKELLPKSVRITCGANAHTRTPVARARGREIEKKQRRIKKVHWVLGAETEYKLCF